MVGVPGKYKGCETCRRRRVKVSRTWGCFPIRPNTPVTRSGEKALDFVDTDIVLRSAATSDLFARNVSIAGENVKATSGKWCSSLERWTPRAVSPRTRRRAATIPSHLAETKSNGEEAAAGLRPLHRPLISL